MITTIAFDENLKKYYATKDNNDRIENLSRLNVFIGPNNSGKSRFLRALFYSDNYGVETTELKASRIAELFSDIRSKLANLIDAHGFPDISSDRIAGLKKALDESIPKLSFISLKEAATIADQVAQLWYGMTHFNAMGASLRQNIIRTNTDLAFFNTLVLTAIKDHEQELDKILTTETLSIKESLYIPILRGLRPTQVFDDKDFVITQDNYFKRTYRDYFQGSEIQDYQIFTGLRLYDDTRKMLLGKSGERAKIRKFERFLGTNFFNGEAVTLIPNIEDDSLHVSIGEEERPIYALGDGIQSIIILLYPLFFNQGKAMRVFIEEPENSMHPGLQRLFIETIMQEQFSSFQYYITTHSNHLLDISADLKKMAVYTFRKKDSDVAIRGEKIYQIENSSNEELNILNLLGVRNSSVFLSNCTIWVEGITDRKYLRKYLELYQKALGAVKSNTYFREDTHFSFVEYGGNNLTHWSFSEDANLDKIKASKISNRIFLIADKDSTKTRPESEKAKRLVALKQVLKDHFEVLPSREIENLLKPSVLIETVKKLEKTNAENIVYKNFTIDKYFDKPLGKFIESEFTNLKRKYAAASGTIGCKLDFCHAAVDSMQDHLDLSTEAYQLAEKLYQFIASANSDTG